MMILWMAVPLLQGCVTVEKTSCVKILADGAEASCDSAPPDSDDTEVEADADTDADADADADADSDADSDADTDSDADADPVARIVFNEVFTHNVDQYRFTENRPADYFELTNLGDAALEISGWLVSRSPDDFTWEVPHGHSLAKGEVVVFTAVGGAGVTVAGYDNFDKNLDNKVDLTLTLTDASGVVMDSVVLPTADNLPDTAFARREDDESWAWTATLTPGTTNVR